MPARVTQNMMNSTLMRNLNNNLRRMDSYQEQLSSGRRINKPSDDPVGLSYSLRYRSEYGANEQYLDNLNAAKGWMDFNDSTLGETGEVLQRIRELTVQAANGTNSQESLNSISSEVSQLYEELKTLGNSQFNGKYIFNGQKTDEPPIDVNAPETSVIDQMNVQFEIGTGVRLAINVTGDKVFGQPTDTDNVFAVTKQLVTDLNTSNFTGINNALGLIDSRMNQFLSVRADVGAKMNRMEFADTRTQDTGVNLQALLSRTEDADIAGVITNLKTAENVYQSSLSVGAKLITPSLIDFLR